MRKILFLALVLVAGTVEAQVQGEAMSVGSNLTGLACRVNEGQTALATESEANFCTTDTKGNLQVSLQSGTASATNPIKLEDSAHTSGDAGVFALAIRNDNLATGLSGTNGDYTGVSVDSNGGLFLSYGTSNAPLKLEDGAPLNNDAGSVALFHAESALSQTVGATNRYGPAKMDLLGRLITTLAPAGEFWDSTSAADITTATTGTLKGSVASNRIYVHSWGCFNTGGAATRVYLEDGSGTRYSHCNLAATTGECFKTLPTPIRLPSASALNVNVVTAGSATRCEAHGYISVN